MATFNGNVYGGSLNLRATPSTGGTALASIPNGTALAITTFGGNKEWFATTYNGQFGYVMARYISVSADGMIGQVTTASGSLNIRIAPASGATILYTAPQYSTLRVLDASSVAGWYRVCGSGGTGWAQLGFITIQGSPAIPAPSVTLTATMQLGSTGAQVTALQNRLNQLRYYCGTADGTFGELTKGAVRYFQDRNALTVDGVVGSASRAVLNSTSIVWGVPHSTYTWGAQQNPQQWFMNGSDQIWRNDPWDAPNTAPVETIGDSGNTPTAMGMILSTCKASAITPIIVCRYALDRGYRDPNGNDGVTSAFYTNVGGDFGITYDGTTTSLATVKTYCQNGGLALAHVTSASPYTAGGSDIVIYKIDDSNRVFTCNPNYNTDDGRIYTTSQWSGWFTTIRLYKKP